MSGIEFKPRNYQEAIIDHMSANPRANVFASPGMGKTSSALVALDAMSFARDVYPALVVGPLRVANSVWSAEVEKWSRLKGLKVVKILGNEAERIKALNTPADIYTTHYGLLKWLAERLGTKGWFFKTVIADESPRLKHHRCRFQRHRTTGKLHLVTGGAKNAANLVSFAPMTPHWYNLTGSPAANGLKDLWGPQWAIDFGATLGSNYTAFTQRWFYQRRGTQREQAIFEPFNDAQDEIMELIKPSSISVNAYDYFDIDRPIERDILTELPERQMKEYRKLHREALLQLQNETVITAVNAGAITNKCLQYASGHVYDEHQVAHKVHDVKLEALDSLVEELNGEPLLVAYNFTSDRDAILKRFPQAELLPSDARQKDVEQRWNEGRIPMLVVHPASAGHGLNLQYGGCNLCIYSPNWNFEFYEQIIERIGPVRQAQAGLNRAVTVYRIITQGTFDTVVTERLASKKSVQQTILEVLK